jgi:hypothetical protein
MSRHATLYAVLVTLAASLVAGCMATEPTTDEHGTIPVTLLPDFSQPPDLAPAGPPTPPIVTGIPQTSQYTSYPLKGQATPGDTVLISGTAVGEVSAEVDPDGSFCALVQLTPNSITTMTLVTVNTQGDMSSSTTWSVTQSGSPPPQGSTMPSVNVALTGTGSSTNDFENGGAEHAMHDGDPTTYVQITNSDFSSTDSITLTLQKAAVIKEIHVRTPSSCALMGTFTIYISDQSPTSPSGPGVQGWTQVSPQPVASDGSDTEWIASFSTPPTVETISVFFPHTLVPSDAAEENAPCGSFEDSEYAISEIEAWTVAGTAPPPPGAPSCGG